MTFIETRRDCNGVFRSYFIIRLFAGSCFLSAAIHCFVANKAFRRQYHFLTLNYFISVVSLQVSASTANLLQGDCQWHRNEMWKWGEHRSGAKVGRGGTDPVRSAGKKFYVVPLHFLALKAQLFVLVSAFVMVSTVWSVSCLLFYSRCPPCPTICKNGGTCPRAPWSRRHWAVDTNSLHSAL